MLKESNQMKSIWTAFELIYQIQHKNHKKKSIRTSSFFIQYNMYVNSVFLTHDKHDFKA